MKPLNLHISNRQILCSLLSAPEGLLESVSSLAALPASLRGAVHLILNNSDWKMLELKHLLRTGESSYHCLGFAGQLDEQRVGIVLHGDRTDANAADSAAKSNGYAVVIGLKPQLSALIDSLAGGGFRLAWQQPSLSCSDASGKIRFAIGRNEDMAVHLDLAWGDAVNTLSVFGSDGSKPF